MWPILHTTRRPTPGRRWSAWPRSRPRRAVPASISVASSSRTAVRPSSFDPPATRPRPAPIDLPVNELLVRFWSHLTAYYRGPDGEPTSEVNGYRLSLRPLEEALRPHLRPRRRAACAEDRSPG